MSDTMKVRLWFLRESAEARCYSRVPLDRPQDASNEVWLPKSQIEHTTKHGVEHVVTIPEWLAVNKNL